MKSTSTGREIQRSEFVDSLYNNLRRKTAEKIENHKQLIAMASSYIKDGLEEPECIELLMIENGLSREAAAGYVSMVKEMGIDDSQNRYSFQFEDVAGKVWSSHDIGRIIVAYSDTDAWEKAEEIVESNPDMEGYTVIAINKM